MPNFDLSNKQLLIFDLDGTLIDSVPDLANSVNFSLKNNNLPIHTTDSIRSFVGNGSYKLCERACPIDSDKALVDKIHDDFLSHYHANTCVATTAYQGVNDGLKRLAKHYTLAIATNKPMRFLPAILGKFGWADLFKMVLGGDSLDKKKPDPAPLLHICQTLGIESGQAIMIGDSKNDILAGQNAGLTTLALSYGYNYDEPIKNSNPDRVFDDFGALAEFLLSAKISGDPYR